MQWRYTRTKLVSEVSMAFFSEVGPRHLHNTRRLRASRAACSVKFVRMYTDTGSFCGSSAELQHI